MRDYIDTISPGSTVTVSDPCYLVPDNGDYRSELLLSYDKSTQSASHMVTVRDEPLAPGEWYAFARIENFGPGGLGGNRVVSSGISLNAIPRISRSRTTEQGVDSGVVSYLINRPDLDRDQTSPDHDTSVSLVRAGPGIAFSTFSGFGDGGYPVLVDYDANDDIVRISMEFIAPEEMPWMVD